MKKRDPNRKPWLQTFEKKWQRVLIILLLVIFIVCMTMSVLYGFELLFPSSQQESTASSSPSSSSSIGTSSAANETATTLVLTADAGRSYLDSTLFLGDSNTVRFMSYNDTDGQPYTTTQNTIAVVGMGINAIDTLACEQMSSGTYTMTQSVPILQPERIIITFGTNNLDGVTTNPSAFITEYTKQLKEIQESYPSVDIIVNSIPPVAAVNQYPKVKILQIELYNTAIEQMCETNGWKYLNSYEALIDETTGYAKTGYMAGDGLHLSQTGLQALFSYIRTHAYETEDDRPKPLEDLPTIIGPLTTMYSVNPLNNEEFSSDVLNPTAEPASSATATSEAVQSTAAATAVPTPTPTPASTPAPAETAAAAVENQAAQTNNSSAVEGTAETSNTAQ